MKRFLFLCMWGLGMNVSGQSSFQIDHGPYLQEMRQDGVTVVFHTSKSSFSKLEVRERGSSALQSYYETAHGLRNADAQFFKIRTEDLKAGTEYEYRICTKEVKSFQPYKVVFGDSLTSKWYSFKTIDPHQKGASIFITSDIHNRPELLEKLLRYCDYQTCTSFFYAGDMMNYMEKSSNENPFSAFIDTSVKLFASSVPFEVVRGNHETRGNLARTFPSYFPKSDGKVYGSYLLGDVMVVMLDCGEDKAASTSTMYVEGTQTFDVNSNQVTNVTVTCAPVCARVKVIYEGMEEYFTDWSATFHTKALDESSFVYEKDKTDPIYLKVDKSETISVNFALINKAGKGTTIDKTYLLNPNEALTITVKPVVSSGNLGIEIEIDDTTNDIPVDIVIPSDWV